LALNSSIFFYRSHDHDSAYDITRQAFKQAVSNLNLSQESAHIVERLQELFFEVIKELIVQKDDKIMDHRPGRRAGLATKRATSFGSRVGKLLYAISVR
jgi:hypothetical protein